MNDHIDRLFSDPLRAPAAFRFDRSVVDVFPDMIRRSVPGYETVIAMSGLLGRRYAQAGSQIYDLGCSLGASTLSICRQVEGTDCRVIGVDNSADMIARCREIMAATDTGVAVELIEADICELELRDASMVVLNYTLQFLSLEQRGPLMQRVYRALRPGGILILSEKLLFTDPTLNALNVAMHHDFKRAHGYSDLEIAGKRESLENVLIAETLEAHRSRLADAGFSASEVWFQCFNFASLIALK